MTFLALLAFDILSYQVGLDIRPQQLLLRGDVMLRVAGVSAGDSLRFHLSANYSLDSLLINGVSSDFTRDSDTVFLVVPGDSCWIRAFYQGNPNDRGLHFRDSTFFTFGQFYDSKAWLFCVDTPSAKAPAQIRITVPPGYVVASNGVLDSVVDTVYYWTETHPVAPYLMVAAGGPYVRLDTSWSGIPISYYVFSGDTGQARQCFENVPDMLKFYDGWFGPYAFADEKLAFVETDDPIGMETQNCIMIGSHVIDSTPKMEYVIAHELAHQWWGDALTPESWAEIWLNEGFAVWSDFNYTQYAYGPDSAMSRWLWAKQLYLREDSSVQYPVRNPLYYTGATVYYKGAWVVRMLRWVMGDSLFFEGLRYYYNTYRDSLVNTDALRDAMAYVAGYCFLWFFTEWTEETGYPVVDYQWSQAGDTLQIIFNQVQDHGPLFQMPVEIMLTAGPDTAWDTVNMYNLSDTFALVPGFQVQQVVVDPNNRVLMLATGESQTEEPGQQPRARLVFEPISRGIVIINPGSEQVPVRMYDPAGRMVFNRAIAPGTNRVLGLSPGVRFIIWPNARAKLLILP